MSEGYADQAIDPWWRIWVQPRQTIRYLIETDPKMHFWVLVTFYGILRAVTLGMQARLGEMFTPFQMAAFIMIAGPLSGVIGVFFTASLLELVGRVFGGVAESQHVRTVLAWATIPMNVLVILGLLPLLAQIGSGVFGGAGFQTRQFLPGSGLLSWRAVMEVLGSFYYLVILVVGLAEVDNEPGATIVQQGGELLLQGGIEGLV